MKVTAIKDHVYGKTRKEGDTYELPEKDVETMLGLGFISVDKPEETTGDPANGKTEPDKTTEITAKGKAGKGKTEESKPENLPIPEPDKTTDPNSPKDLETK